jgi:hypothetical protein
VCLLLRGEREKPEGRGATERLQDANRRNNQRQQHRGV